MACTHMPFLMACGQDRIVGSDSVSCFVRSSAVFGREESHVQFTFGDNMVAVSIFDSHIPGQ